MSDDQADDAEQYREYLGLLGRSQLDGQLMGKVGLPGVGQLTCWKPSMRIGHNWTKKNGCLGCIVCSLATC